METNPDVEFDHYLAQKLGMTVGALHREMSAGEYLRWSVYYGRLAQKQELAHLKGKG